MSGKQESVIEPLDEAVDHVRGPASSALIVVYGHYECPYSRRAFREIERVEARLDGVELTRFESDRSGQAVLERIRRDVQSAIASGEVRGAPTLFIDGAVHRGTYDAEELLGVLAR